MFISPEALFLATEWRRMLAGDLYGKNLVGFVVDEVHCMKKWYVCKLACDNWIKWQEQHRKFF